MSSPITLTIDGKPVSVPDGATLLDAARALSIDIPTLCFRPGHDALTTCMVCLVRVEGQARFVPSCATKARHGMVVHSESDEVHRARRTALELLLSDHAGDCLAPCQLVCPAHMHIDEMLRLIAEKDFRRALEVVKENIPLPATLGRICPDLCEKGCRRSQHDSAVSICQLKRFVADVDLASPEPYVAAKRAATGKRVAIVGAGPAGLSAAYYLLLAGHEVTVYDAHPLPGGNLRYAIAPEVLPPSVVDAEVAIIRTLGMRFVGDTPLIATPANGHGITLDQLRAGADAVLIATGAADPALAKAMGFTVAGKGLAVNKHTGQTNLPGVFAAGAAITPHRLAVRAVGDGHHVAKSIGAFFAGLLEHGHNELFSVRLNVLSPSELEVMLAGAAPLPRGHDVAISPERAVAEAARCIHCGCASASDCALRAHGATYDANPHHFKGERRSITPMEVSSVQCPVSSSVVFEPGKCISCGRCVQITAESNEPLGQSYTGRGFDMRIKPPFDAAFAEAVTKCAEEVVAACPTAAIRWGTPPKGGTTN